jgi:hypothetical protein
MFGFGVSNGIHIVIFDKKENKQMSIMFQLFVQRWSSQWEPTYWIYMKASQVLLPSVG